MINSKEGFVRLPATPVFLVEHTPRRPVTIAGCEAERMVPARGQTLISASVPISENAFFSPANYSGHLEGSAELAVNRNTRTCNLTCYFIDGECVVCDAHE